MPDTARLKATPVNITTRIFSAVYDFIMLFAVTFLFVALPITFIDTAMGVSPEKWVQNLLFTTVAFAYYVGFWHKGDGATTGMRPWKLRVVNVDTGAVPSLTEATVRFLGFGITMIALGVTAIDLKTGDTQGLLFVVSSLIPLASLLSMLFSAKKQPLHDLIAGTNIYRVFPKQSD